MNSLVIKFAAGGGKTTYCLDYLKNNKNGLYLAFNNSVVDKIQENGFLARTIDSFFHSFIIPKFVSQIPLVANNCGIEYLKTDRIPSNYLGVGNIKINSADGYLYYKNVKTSYSLDTESNALWSSYEKYTFFLRYIFDKSVLRITDDLRSGLSSYLLKKYAREIVSFVMKRFSYVIIDEAQDLFGYKEEFAKIIYESNIRLIVLGDDNQNINNGGKWFEGLSPDKTKIGSFRCPNDNCEWIRNNLGIEIFGNGNSSHFKIIPLEKVGELDNGNTVLLYAGKSGTKLIEIVDCWKGPKKTIKKSKGETIYQDVVIVGDSLSKKAYYTAITRTTKDVYSTITKVNK